MKGERMVGGGGGGGGGLFPPGKTTLLQIRKMYKSLLKE